jgi:hypothetical protein
MDTAKEELTVIASSAVELGKSLFEQNGYGSMSWIGLFLGIGDDEKAIVVSPEGVPPGNLYDVVCEICKRIPFTVKGICLIMDTYSLHIDASSYTEAEKKFRDELLAGDLGTLFKEGDPRVREALSVCVMSEGGNVMASLPYKWTPVDGWEWDEEESVPEDAAIDWEFERIVAGLPKRETEMP